MLHKLDLDSGQGAVVLIKFEKNNGTSLQQLAIYHYLFCTAFKSIDGTT